MFASSNNIQRLTQSVQSNALSGADSSSGSTKIGDHITKKLVQNPQFDYLFMITLPELGGISTDEINHRVFSVNAPTTEFESSKNTDMGTFMYSAGHADIGTLNLVIDEMEDGATLSYILEWQKKMKNDDGTYNPPADYKFDIKVIRMSASKMEGSTHVYKAYFPTSIEAMTFSHDSNQVLQYSITFTGDDVQHEMIKPAQLKGLINAYTG